jgi:hypothetical protein
MSNRLVLEADAFAADPKLAGDLQGGHRYRAARCAALAAAGRGTDAQPLDDRDGPGLRRQALDRLCADLAAWAKVNDRSAVSRTLRRWQRETDLAAVRDDEALAKLPRSEREAWGQLWSDVAQLKPTGSSLICL